MMIISIKYSQIEAGMQASILERLDIPIPNLTAYMGDVHPTIPI
jgi:di/tripeptidase